ncbi:hypothetical protein [Haloferula sp. BvORR071]|uniref:hypothetical protein n=1 Tax=Haloferula sp. BvORR071 TaxID=1396141 RepID=UPI0005540697|nr:hypothetical protein [Haloferula sp. BvORR071]
MRFLPVALAFLWTLLLAAPALAQDEEIVVPPAPENLVLDTGRVFAREPEKLKAVAAALGALQDKHGYRLYFVVYDSLIGRTLEQQAAALQAKWLGEQPGMILVLESDSFSWRYGQAPPKEEELEPGNIVKRNRPTELSVFELKQIEGELEQSLLAVSKDRQAFAETLGTGVASGIGKLLDQRAAAPASSSRTRTALLSIGLIAVAGLVSLLVVAVLKRAEAKARERYVFPKVGVAMRLGAPYGGGKVSARDFGGRS